MKEKIGPAVFFSDPSYCSRIYLRTTQTKAIGVAETLFKQYNNDYPFTYAFLDDSFNKLYLSEQREGRLFLYFTAVAIMISCLGLFGLAAFSANIRFREIGVRKVLGASVGGIVQLLAKESFGAIACQFI